MHCKRWLAGVSILLACIHAAPAQPAAPTAPKTYQIDGQWLLHLRAQPEDPTVKAAAAQADAAMHAGPFTVTAKNQSPPSGDKHDYMSLARYFWPNPATPDHLPYVQRDGQSNPQIDSIPDHENIFRMEDSVHALALGYALTGREPYAARATLLLRTWFLDPKTKMNPNLQYAQAVLGVNGGRGRGILDARGLPDVTDAVAMLQGSKSWTPEDDAAIRGWFADYYRWLTASDNGRNEAEAKNNHGSWYDFQVVGIALFLGRQGDARAILVNVQTRRIALQIDAEGRQPLELARTKSFGYCVFNLEALMRLADYGAAVGVDLWRYQAPGGGSIRAALDYLLPYALHEAHWAHEDITGFRGDELRLPLLRAAVRFHDRRYLEAAGRLKGKDDGEGLLLRSRANTL